MKSIEQKRITDNYEKKVNWLKWGPYLSERQWGTVREDYSADGNAWNYISHDMARSKSYRWGEEGIAGFSDDKQTLCLALALWNGNDPILKERLFGLTNNEGNHGEDVKELYYYLDSTPTHSYMKMLYKYTLDAYPYLHLKSENQGRGKFDPEFELIDTGLFDNNRYFDIFIEYAKNTEDDFLVQYTVINRADEDANLHLIPQLWFRNTWNYDAGYLKPQISSPAKNLLLLNSEVLGDYHCYVEGDPEFLFTDNETNYQRLYSAENISKYVKDGINNRVVNGKLEEVNPQQVGTKAAAWYQLKINPGATTQVRLRLTKNKQGKPFSNFEKILDERKTEADAFYAEKQIKTKTQDEQLVQRQAWAGLLWSKQYYFYDVNRWLDGDPGHIPPPQSRRAQRNKHWKHFFADQVISMPDKWEYPWFAAWDLAFHCIAFEPIDPHFAKNQLKLLIDTEYIHPNGQLPAYEWDFGDVNPPVHALAAWRIYLADKQNTSKGDFLFLESIFHKLLLNFTWWVNQKDIQGNNIFEGGFLGLDNIGVFNRSAPVPGGGILEQADGTSWMAMYALNMLEMSMELAMTNPVYEDMSIKFFEHFLYIAGSIANMGEESIGLWDDQDGFYYDLLHRSDGSWDRLRLRTMVGLIPLFAVIVFDEEKWKSLLKLKLHLESLMSQRPDLVSLVSSWTTIKGHNKHLLSLLRGHRMKLLLRRMLDNAEFLSDYGIRSVSKVYNEHPYHYSLNGSDFTVKYVPAESDSNMFGGNSNWRGPIWMPLNYLLIDSLKKFEEYYTDDFRVEYPTGSNQYFSLSEIADQLSGRLKSLFLRNENGERPIFGGHTKFNHDPNFSDYILFYEYFHGDNGRGLGASHQTGWTGLISLL